MAEFDLGKVVGPTGPMGPKGDKGDPGLVEKIEGTPNPTNTVMSGKKVYCKEVWLGELKSRGHSSIDLGIPNFEYAWIDMQNSMVYSNGGNIYPICYNDGTSFIASSINRAKKTLEVETSGDWPGYSLYAVIRYY